MKDMEWAVHISINGMKWLHIRAVFGREHNALQFDGKELWVRGYKASVRNIVNAEHVL